MSQIPFLGKLCSALGCKNRQNLENTEKGLSFHRFPMTKAVMLKQWIENVNRPDLEPTRFCILCSAHFESNCFIESKPSIDGTVRRRLRNGSVPTLNLGAHNIKQHSTSLGPTSYRPNHAVSFLKKKRRWGKRRPAIAPRITDDDSDTRSEFDEPITNNQDSRKISELSWNIGGANDVNNELALNWCENGTHAEAHSQTEVSAIFNSQKENDPLSLEESHISAKPLKKFLRRRIHRITLSSRRRSSLVKQAIRRKNLQHISLHRRKERAYTTPFTYSIPICTNIEQRLFPDNSTTSNKCPDNSFQFDNDDDVSDEMEGEKVKMSISDVNTLFVCGLCNGYLCNAATITECFHTFCKSCLWRHVTFNLHCPTCKALIHPTDPHVNIRMDRRMQELLYKLLPEIKDEEKKRETEFYQDHKPSSTSSTDLVQSFWPIPSAILQKKRRSSKVTMVSSCLKSEGEAVSESIISFGDNNSQPPLLKTFDLEKNMTEGQKDNGTEGYLVADCTSIANDNFSEKLSSISNTLSPANDIFATRNSSKAFSTSAISNTSLTNHTSTQSYRETISKGGRYSSVKMLFAKEDPLSAESSAHAESEVAEYSYDDNNCLAVKLESDRSLKSQLKPLKKKYLWIPRQTTIAHIEKFIQKKLALDNSVKLRIFYNNALLSLSSVVQDLVSNKENLHRNKKVLELKYTSDIVKTTTDSSTLSVANCDSS